MVSVATSSGIRLETVRHDHFSYPIDNANLQLMNTIKLAQSGQLMNDAGY